MFKFQLFVNFLIRRTGSWKSQICEKCASYFIIMIVNKFCCWEKCFFVHEYCTSVLLRRGIGDKRIQRSRSWVSLFHGRSARVHGALESREKLYSVGTCMEFLVRILQGGAVELEISSTVRPLTLTRLESLSLLSPYSPFLPIRGP